MMECGLLFMLDILYNATLQCQNVWPKKYSLSLFFFLQKKKCLYNTCSCDLKTPQKLNSNSKLMCENNKFFPQHFLINLVKNSNN